ncbi:MAG: UDP-N-acetylmuramyl-tripeptide synthetase [Candidatus Paceibacterota bacterium]|jgi:UDP-N-acetylmuramoyl-L-alanyl-D-glutamate--2,6-diaminopimelate ligase
MFKILKKIIPKSVFQFFQPTYHYLLAFLGALIYRFPAQKLIVIGVTGTKGKTTTVELVNAILESTGYKTALQSTLRFKIAKKEKRNLFKMSMPGRFFVQKFLRDAVTAGCSHAIIEMTSEGAKQFRHKFIHPDALIFTNLAPEHIESHGSYEKYLQAKLSIARELESPKKKFMKKVWPVSTRRSEDFLKEPFSLGSVIIANTDDKEGKKFLALNIQNKIPYSLNDAINVKATEKGSSFQLGKLVVHSKLPGIFNVSNMLGAIALAKFMNIPDEKIKKGLEDINFIRGRMEKIENNLDIDIVVDYAHTPDSLMAVYGTYNSHMKIAVLGNTGGGRDTWKRKVMGEIADKYCDQIILTNEDPYDEDPRKIIEDVKVGITKKQVEIIIDRREAIATAIKKALTIKKESGDKYKVAVLITGKGTDPYIMEAGGKKTPWDDAEVAREELQTILNK